MLLKSNRRDPKELIQSLADDSRSLTLPVRDFVKAINRFHLQLELYRELLLDLNVFSPLADYVEEIESSLQEGIFWISDCLEMKISLVELLSNLENDTAQGFEASLDVPLAQCCATYDATTIVCQDNVNDIDALCERVRDDIRVKGYILHSVLIGAA